MAEPSSAAKKRKWGTACAYKGCGYKFYPGNGNPRRRFFRFPREKTVSDVWIKNCGREELFGKDTEKLFNNFRLCSAHFRDEMFFSSKKFRLLPQAVPDDYLNVSAATEDTDATNSFHNETPCIKTEFCEEPPIETIEVLPYIQVYPVKHEPIDQPNETTSNCKIVPQMSHVEIQTSRTLLQLQRTEKESKMMKTITSLRKENTALKKEIEQMLIRQRTQKTELSVSSDENSDQEEMDTSSENTQNTSASHDLQATRSRTRKRQLEAEKVTEEDPRIAEAYDIIQNCARRDASDVYGEYVASKLRSYNKRTEAVVQHLINNILYNADRGVYDKDANVEDSSVGNQNVCLKSRRSTPSPQSVYFNENQNCSVFPEDLLARHSTSLDDPLNP